MGLNHQMASLSCALGEAYVTKRTLLLPPTICLFALHTERWSSSSGPGENCVPIETLFDLQALSKLVSVQVLSRNETDADKKPARRSRVLGGAQRVTPSPIAHISGSGWPSARIAREYPCGGGAALVRRSVNTFWFQQCARRLTDYNTLATELNRLVGAPPNAAKPMNIILRSGLFFSQNIKAAAREIRTAIGGPYASLHVRRSDKLTAKSKEVEINGQKVSIPAACNPEDCKTRDMQTRPEAIERTLGLWLPAGSRVYVGSTEPPSFFAPLRRTFKLHFAEDFGATLTRLGITNNYALYAVETLLFFGSQASVESLSFQSGWFVDACFPAASMRVGGMRGAGANSVWRRALGMGRWPNASSAPSSAASSAPVAPAAPSAAVDLQCRDTSGALINGVLYGPACADNRPCGKGMYLAPAPKPCGQPRLSERLMLTNRTSARGARRCAALTPDGRGELRTPREARGAARGNSLGPAALLGSIGKKRIGKLAGAGKLSGKTGGGGIGGKLGGLLGKLGAKLGGGKSGGKSGGWSSLGKQGGGKLGKVAPTTVSEAADAETPVTPA